MSILLTEIFDLLKPFVESYVQTVLDESGINLIKNVNIRYIVEKEKDRTWQEIHELIDFNEDNRLITSEEFYTFIKFDANVLIKQLLEINWHVIPKESVEKQLEELLVLYDSKFSKNSPYERSLGASFIKRFFEICFNFKKQVFLSLIKGDVSRILEHQINNNMLLKINETVEEMLKNFQVIYDHIELKNQITSVDVKYEISDLSRETIKNFAKAFVKPLVFEEPYGAKTLKEVYVWPEYKSDLLMYAQDDLHELINNYLEGNLKIYLYDKKIPKLKLNPNYNLLLILGMGGMGKSSLLEKMAFNILNNKIKANASNIFFIKFSAMEYVNDNLLDNITSFLKIEKKILKDSIIVLDAFDEYVSNIKEKQEMIEVFCQEIQMLNCRAIITSRENYIDTESLQNTCVIKLLTFNVRKRKEWLNKYNKNLSLQVVEDICNYKDEKDVDGEEFIGIPIIIYMIASNNIKIMDYKSKFELYNALFGKNGLWYKRMYDINHPILLARKEVFYNFILNIAEKMFRNDKLSISGIEIEHIIERIFPRKDIEYIKNCYGIITYFKRKKISEIEFAHKSIFEYYIANRIHIQLEKITKEENDEVQYNMLWEIFNKGIVSKEILDFLDGFFEYDIEKYNQQTIKKLFCISINIDRIFTKKYFANLDECYNYFCNSVNCLGKLLEKKCNARYVDIINEQNCVNMCFFLKNKYYNYIFLKRFDLSNKNFNRVFFRNMDLSKSNMRDANFSYCDFSGANLQECDLRNSNLFSSIFCNTDLHYADLRGSNLNNMIIKRDPLYFGNTKININQIRYFWPEITLMYKRFQIYSKESILATEQEIEFEFDKIRGFHLKI